MKLLDNKFLGLRLVDSNDEYIVNVTWDSWLDNRWTSHILEDGQEIIGLRCHIGDKSYIPRLGFFVWKP